MEEIYQVNANEYIEKMDLSGFTKDTSLISATPKNQWLHPPYKPLHQKSIPSHHQLQTKATPIRRIQIQNRNFKAGVDLELIWGRCTIFLLLLLLLKSLFNVGQNIA